VTFLVAGTYVLRLTANDGELETVDEETVTGVDANAPPEVNAGSDLTIRWPTASVTLAGSASDDGELNATLALQWTLLSGPSAVAFGSAEAPSTTVTFPSEGVYVLRLTAYDGEFEVGDDVAVTVNSESPPPSEPPPPPPPPPSSPPAEEPPAEEPPAEQPPPVGGGGAGGAGDPDTGGGDAGAVVVPAGGSGGGRFNLLELLLLGALALVGRHRARRLGNDPVGITH
jgi:hypothetical protein